MLKSRLKEVLRNRVICGLLSVTIIPSLTFSEQAVTGADCPFISTKQSRHEATGRCISLMLHKLGIKKPLSSAAHNKLDPGCTLVSLLSMMMVQSMFQRYQKRKAGYKFVTRPVPHVMQILALDSAHDLTVSGPELDEKRHLPKGMGRA